MLEGKPSGDVPLETVALADVVLPEIGKVLMLGEAQDVFTRFEEEEEEDPKSNFAIGGNQDTTLGVAFAFC